MINKIGKVISGIGSMLVAMTWLSWTAIHVLTIVVAFQISGVFSAVLTFIFPFIAQIYWIWKTWFLSGELINDYTYWIVVSIGYWFVGISLVIAGGLIQRDR